MVAVRCKICGNLPVVRKVCEFDQPSMNDFWQVACHHINEGLFIIRGDSEDSAISMWNSMHTQSDELRLLRIDNQRLHDIINRLECEHKQLMKEKARADTLKLTLDQIIENRDMWEKIAGENAEKANKANKAESELAELKTSSRELSWQDMMQIYDQYHDSCYGNRDTTWQNAHEESFKKIRETIYGSV